MVVLADNVGEVECKGEEECEGELDAEDEGEGEGISGVVLGEDVEACLVSIAC